MARRRSSLAAFLFVTFVAGAASAQVVPWVDRPVVTPEGRGQLGVDATIGLDSGGAPNKAGHRILLMSDYIGDRTGGLSFQYGAYKRVEVGAAIVAGWSDQGYVTASGPANPGFQFGGAYVWGRYSLAKFMAGELGVRLPGQNLSDRRAAIDVGLPMNIVLSPGLFGLHARPDLTFAFARSSSLYSDGQPLQVSFQLDGGATLNLMPELFFDVSFSLRKSLNPADVDVVDYPVNLPATDPNNGRASKSSHWVVPMAFTVGYTVIPTLDLYATFVLEDLNRTGAIGRTDQKGLTISGRYRF
jgi:hypothetical protein